MTIMKVVRSGFYLLVQYSDSKYSKSQAVTQASVCFPVNMHFSVAVVMK